VQKEDKLRRTKKELLELNNTKVDPVKFVTKIATTIATKERTLHYTALYKGRRIRK